MTGMHKLIHQIRGSEFLRHNAIVFAGAAVVSVLNYLYYPVLGHLLAPAAFGEVQTVVSLFLQIAIFLSVLGLLTVNITANHGDSPQAQRTILELEKLALAISVVALVTVVAAGPVLQRFFNFDSVMPFVLLALANVVSVPATFRAAYLRGKKQFGGNSWASLIGSAAKLLVSALLVWLGLGVSGAVAGLVVAQTLSFVYAATRARRAGFQLSLRDGFLRPPDIRLLAPELRYGLLVLAGSLAITVQYSIDIVAVKHYFDAHTAGLYAGIATVARIIFFLTGSVAQVLQPSVTLDNPPTRNRQVLLKSLYLTVGLSGAALLFFVLFPGFTVGLLMGKEYLTYSSLLPRLGLVIFVVSILNLFVLYYLSLRRYAIGFVAIMGLAVTCGLVIMHHDSLRAVIDSMLAGSLAMGGLLAVWAGSARLRTGRAEISAQRTRE